MCQIVLNSNRLCRTLTLTFFAGNAANLAGIHNSLSFFSGAAGHCVLLLIRDQLDQMSRANGHTFTAGLTFFLVHLGNAVHNMYRVKRTNLNAAAGAQTAKAAGFCSAVLHLGNHLTVRNTCLFI